MESPDPWSSKGQSNNDVEKQPTQKRSVFRKPYRAGTLDQLFIGRIIKKPGITRIAADNMETPQDSNIAEDRYADIAHPDIIDQNSHALDRLQTRKVEMPVAQNAKKATRPLPLKEATGNVPHTPVLAQENEPGQVPSSSLQTPLKKGTALLLITILGMLVLRTLTSDPTSFLGSQGWAFVLNGPAMTSSANLLKNVNTNLKQRTSTKTSPKAQITPQQYIDLIISKMTLDQKLGQMMIVQFTGSTYALPISTMISQYNIGAVLIFSANGNIVSKEQLTGLIKQMKDNSAPIPLTVAIDQEGGTVDRLANLDGPRPAEATIGATNNPAQAKQAGTQDAKDLASYGFNLNLAPVVDVTNVYNSQLYDRTYGDTAGLVTKMAAAYLQGLQQSGRVMGTLKHFPGLGDVDTDPHIGIPYLNRSKSDLEQIDWAPYRALIRQGNVHAIMVTHEIVSALDKTEPSSLSPKIIQGILRDDLGFQGVVMTDSLTMDALTAYASESQAAALSVKAGADLLMGATSPDDVASMIQSLKQAINAGALTEQRINESVRRILMMKYAMGLLPIPQN